MSNRRLHRSLYQGFNKETIDLENGGMKKNFVFFGIGVGYKVYEGIKLNLAYEYSMFQTNPTVITVKKIKRYNFLIGTSLQIN
jgi:opacity protein-like surface antigen